MFFAKKRNKLFSDDGKATPLKIKIGEYEISLAGDDSLGGFDAYVRTHLAVFNNESETIESIDYPSFDDLTRIVEKYRRIRKHEKR